MSLGTSTTQGSPTPDAALSYASVDPALAASLKAGMAHVERRLQEATVADDPFISEAASHLAAAGGKRFRPLLVLVASHFGDPSAPGVIPAAVVMELTHLATLYHDDVMDEAPRRRGAASANERWGNAVAILTGDFLFARAAEILADLGADAVRMQAQTFQRLCTGQIRETAGPPHGADPIEHHLSVLADKTGSLIATSACFGARLAGADEYVVDTLTLFGERIGVAFQLADDLVDITSPSAASGKTPGTDLREGVVTLAGLFALRSEDPADARLRELLGRRSLSDDDEHAEALALLRRHEGLEYARAQARSWADDARRLLAPLPATPSRKALYQLCDYVVGRVA